MCFWCLAVVQVYCRKRDNHHAHRSSTRCLLVSALHTFSHHGGKGDAAEWSVQAEWSGSRASMDVARNLMPYQPSKLSEVDWELQKRSPGSYQKTFLDKAACHPIVAISGSACEGWGIPVLAICPSECMAVMNHWQSVKTSRIEELIQAQHSGCTKKLQELDFMIAFSQILDADNPWWSSVGFHLILDIVLRQSHFDCIECHTFSIIFGSLCDLPQLFDIGHSVWRILLRIKNCWQCHCPQWHCQLWWLLDLHESSATDASGDWAKAFQQLNLADSAKASAKSNGARTSMLKKLQRPSRFLVEALHEIGLPVFGTKATKKQGGSLLTRGAWDVSGKRVRSIEGMPQRSLVEVWWIVMVSPRKLVKEHKACLLWCNSQGKLQTVSRANRKEQNGNSLRSLFVVGWPSTDVSWH